MTTPWVPGLPVSDSRQAELMAAHAMRSMGYLDAEATPVGPDGGVDVRSDRAIAQVKWRAVQVGRSELQALFGARGTRFELDLLFFTGTSYSAKAVDYALEHDVALFTYDLAGTVTPVSPAAVQMLSRHSAERPAPERERSHHPAAPAAPDRFHRVARAQRVPPRPAPTPVPPLSRTWWKRHWWQVVTVVYWCALPVFVVQAIVGAADWGQPVVALVIAGAGTLAWRARFRRQGRRRPG